MPVYQITNADGSTNTILAELDFVEQHYPGTWVQLPDPIQEPEQEQAKRTLTKLEYMNRFTDAELAGIYTAAKSVIQVEIWLEKFKLATEVNLDDPATAAGLQAMEAAGLLAPGRAAEILA